MDTFVIGFHKGESDTAEFKILNMKFVDQLIRKIFGDDALTGIPDPTNGKTAYYKVNIPSALKDPENEEELYDRKGTDELVLAKYERLRLGKTLYLRTLSKPIDLGGKKTHMYEYSPVEIPKEAPKKDEEGVPYFLRIKSRKSTVTFVFWEFPELIAKRLHEDESDILKTIEKLFGTTEIWSRDGDHRQKFDVTLRDGGPKNQEEFDAFLKKHRKIMVGDQGFYVLTGVLLDEHYSYVFHYARLC